MKKVVTFVLALSMMLTLTSCDMFDDSVRFDSLGDYIKPDEKLCPRSNFSIDRPDYFLPSETFITDYAYICGEYHYYDEFKITSRTRPHICILVLRYDRQVYSDAKAYMIENIPDYNDLRYIYGDYIFYENANFVEGYGNRYFPRWFTMACYNDTKQELVFIGLYGTVDQKYKDDPQGNWVSFIDTYYGEYYDFSE